MVRGIPLARLAAAGVRAEIAPVARNLRLRFSREDVAGVWDRQRQLPE